MLIIERRKNVRIYRARGEVAKILKLQPSNRHPPIVCVKATSEQEKFGRVHPLVALGSKELVSDSEKPGKMLRLVVRSKLGKEHFHFAHLGRHLLAKVTEFTPVIEANGLGQLEFFVQR